MVATIIIAIAVLISVVLIIAVAKPDTFRVQRSAAIAAPPEKIFPLINDLRSHLSWSPFEKDPAMKRKMSGAESGKGSVYEWEGNNKVGAGRIEILDTSAPSKVTMALHMLKPFEAHNTVEFTIEPNGSATNVTWLMYGRQPFMAKLMSTFIDCDNMVGREFETGLASLKTLAER
jgi:uncharacterized protein YndB with AHSA1/START domain